MGDMGIVRFPPRKYSEAVVTELALKLKGVGQITAEDLSILMYALGENEEHISAFFSVNGALQSLVGELTGTDAKKQLFSAGCLCNLSLGPQRSCFSVTKCSGTYLITYLQNGNSNFVELCAWTLGNLYASSEKVAQLLNSQGLFGGLIPLIDNNHDLKVVDAAAYALGHIIFSKWCLLDNSQVEELTRNVLSCRHKSEQIYWLLYLLSGNDGANKEFSSKSLMKLALIELISYLKMNVVFDTLVINCLIRTMANTCCKEVLYGGGTLEIINSEPFVEIVNSLFNRHVKDLSKDLLWLIGNIYCALDDNDKHQPFFRGISMSLYRTINKL